MLKVKKALYRYDLGIHTMRKIQGFLQGLKRHWYINDDSQPL